MKPFLVWGLLSCGWLATAHGETPPGATAPPAAADPTASDAAKLLAELLEPLASRAAGPQVASIDATLYVRPLPLLEAVERSGDRSRRLWIAQAYWKVSAAYASVRCCTEAIERVEMIAPGGDPHDRATLDVAAAAARADLADRAAAQAMAMAEADHAKGQRPIEAVIAAHAALVGQQREFLLATKAYNLDIAEYAMAVADLSVPDDRFVSMLIGSPIQWRQPQPAADGQGSSPGRDATMIP